MLIFFSYSVNAVLHFHRELVSTVVPQFGSVVCVVRNTGSILQRETCQHFPLYIWINLWILPFVSERDLLKLNVKCLIYLFKWCDDSQSFKGCCSSLVINFHEIWGHARDVGSKSVPQSHWHFCQTCGSRTKTRQILHFPIMQLCSS